jgi:ATP-binding cassette subfamily C (CFTR/MRP) protein 1
MAGLSMTLTGLAFVCIGSKYMAATIPVTGFAVYMVGRFYLQTSRQIRLLDLESKSPLYQNFSETMEGMQTIRAFGWQRSFENSAFQSLDVSQKPFYLLYCIQRWLNLILDLTTAVVGISVVALAVCLPQSSSSGSLGVALTSLLSFNAALQQLIGAYTNAETVIGSVTRTKDFEEETPQETSDKDARDPGPSWPQGRIQVSNATVVYG